MQAGNGNSLMAGWSIRSHGQFSSWSSSHGDILQHIYSMFMGSRQELQSTTELHGSSGCLYSDHVSAHDMSFDLEFEPNKLFMRVYLCVAVCCFTSLFT